LIISNKKLFIKRRPHSEGVVQCGHLSDKERGSSSGADVRSFRRKKLRIFPNLWYVRTVNFYFLCGRLSWTYS